MLKKYLLSVLAVFVLWSVTGFIIHGVILAKAYQATAQLWRPYAEMKLGLTYLSTFIATATFVGIYMLLVSPKSIKNGIFYGLLIGLLSGIRMALGTYSSMPITVTIAAVWFGGTVIEMALAGLCIGAIFKSNK